MTSGFQQKIFHLKSDQIMMRNCHHPSWITVCPPSPSPLSCFQCWTRETAWHSWSYPCPACAPPAACWCCLSSGWRLGRSSSKGIPLGRRWMDLPHSLGVQQSLWWTSTRAWCLRHLSVSPCFSSIFDLLVFEYTLLLAIYSRLILKK